MISKTFPYTLSKIRRGTPLSYPDGPEYIYAEVRDETGKLCVSATLKYCYEWLRERATEK